MCSNVWVRLVLWVPVPVREMALSANCEVETGENSPQ